MCRASGPVTDGGYTLSFACAYGLRAVVDALCPEHRATLETDPSLPLVDLARRELADAQVIECCNCERVQPRAELTFYAACNDEESCEEALRAKTAARRAGARP